MASKGLTSIYEGISFLSDMCSHLRLLDIHCPRSKAQSLGNWWIQATPAINP